MPNLSPTLVLTKHTLPSRGSKRILITVAGHIHNDNHIDIRILTSYHYFSLDVTRNVSVTLARTLSCNFFVPVPIPVRVPLTLSTLTNSNPNYKHNHNCNRNRNHNHNSEP